MFKRIACLGLILTLCGSLGYSTASWSETPSSSMWSRFSKTFIRFNDYFGKKEGASKSSGGGSAASSGDCGPYTCLLAAYALKQMICHDAFIAAHKDGATPKDIQKIYDDAMKKFGSACGDIKTIQGDAQIESATGGNSGPTMWDENGNLIPAGPGALIDDCIKREKEYLTATPVCGNGINEKGEQCDPKSPIFCKGCNPVTCQCPGKSKDLGESDTTCPKVTCPTCPKVICGQSSDKGTPTDPYAGKGTPTDPYASKGTPTDPYANTGQTFLCPACPACPAPPQCPKPPECPKAPTTNPPGGNCGPLGCGK